MDHMLCLDWAQSWLISLLRGEPYAGAGLCQLPGLSGPGLPGGLLRLLPPPDKKLHPRDGDDQVDHNSELNIATLRPGNVRYQHPPTA